MPGAQAEQDESPGRTALPAAHWRHAPPSRTRPSSHAHAAEDAAPVPFVVENAGQSVHADDSFPLAYVFLGHTAHALVPASVLNVPTGHFLQSNPCTC